MDSDNPETEANTAIRNEVAVAGSLVGQRILQRYSVRRLLGVGAMGHVLEVRDSQSGEDAAVKCVPAQLASNEAHMRALQANYDLVKGLVHPHIAALRALERDPDNGQYYLLMELVRGSDLSHWIPAQRAINPVIPIGTVLGIAEQIAMALDYAHSFPVPASASRSKKFGILHRDLKPANVMVEKNAEFRAGVPYVKLVDFGLAAQIQASLHSISLSSLNKMAGTPVYMAPEQWEGRTLTRGVDQWALAVMIYEMAAGFRPFDGPTEAIVMANVRNANPVKPETFSNSQWDALRIALSADRRKRYRSCVALVKALADANPLTSESIVAAELTMPDEFAGMAIGKESNLDEAQQERAAGTASPRPFFSIMKWGFVAALLAIAAGYLAYAMVTNPASPLRAWLNKSRGATVATSSSEVIPLANNAAKVKVDEAELNRRRQVEAAHGALTLAMEQITDPNSKRTWERIKYILEKPVAMPLNADHPSLAAAQKLLAAAKAELAKAPAFEKKLQEAKDLLAAHRHEEALKAFQEARLLWPESGRFDEIFNGVKQARDAIGQSRIDQNRESFNDAWTKAQDAKAAGKWDEVPHALGPLLDIDGNNAFPNSAAAQKLLAEAQQKLDFEKKLANGQSLVDARRFEDALNFYNGLLKPDTDPSMKSPIIDRINKLNQRWAKEKEDIKREAASR